MPYLPPSPYQEFCPPALTDAAVPLAGTRSLLRAVADDARGIAGYCDSSPSEGVRQAVRQFLDAYGGAAFTLSVTAGDLSTNLRLAAQEYRGTEQALYDEAMALSPRSRS